MQLADPATILAHYTDFGRVGNHNVAFQARCFVRYRYGRNEWKSFWERSRNSREIPEERDYEWSHDEMLSNAWHAEVYVIRRIEIDYSIVLYKEPLTNQIHQQPRNVSECYYTCKPRGLYCHYAGAKFTTRYHRPDQIFRIKCLYPKNIIYEKDYKFTCFNPQIVETSDKDVLDPTPDVVTCVGLDEGVLYWEKRENGRPDWNEILLDCYREEKVEIEIYLNTSPCEDCLMKMLKFIKQYYNVVIHVKYATFYYRSKQQDFDSVNSAKGENRLKITPFTDIDWKVLNEQIVLLQESLQTSLAKELDDLNEAKETERRRANRLEDDLAQLRRRQTQGNRVIPMMPLPLNPRIPQGPSFSQTGIFPARQPYNPNMMQGLPPEPSYSIPMRPYYFDDYGNVRPGPR